jgi:hypothetical protein
MERRGAEKDFNEHMICNSGEHSWAFGHIQNKERNTRQVAKDLACSKWDILLDTQIS